MRYEFKQRTLPRSHAYVSASKAVDGKSFNLISHEIVILKRKGHRMIRDVVKMNFKRVSRETANDVYYSSFSDNKSKERLARRFIALVFIVGQIQIYVHSQSLKSFK